MMVAASSERNRVRCLSLCAASWGFAIGISLLGVWDRPAPPGQLPGLMTMLGRDAHASFRFMAGIVVMTIAMAFAMRPVVRRLATAEARAWSRNGAAAAMLAALWIAIISTDLPWVIVAPAIAIVVCVALRTRRMDFTRHDAILLPVFETIFLALIDMSSIAVDRAAIAAAGIVLAIRIALPFIRSSRGLAPALCFSLAPLALMAQTMLFARDQRYSPWPALIIAVITPFLLRALVRDSPLIRRRLRTAIAYVIYPLAAFGYMNATSIVAAEGKPRIDFFEDG
ncbi:MAG: hypothetical protein ACXV7D_16535, partial [Thermoanaerobaculia bacterium]